MKQKHREDIRLPIDLAFVKPLSQLEIQQLFSRYLIMPVHTLRALMNDPETKVSVIEALTIKAIDKALSCEAPLDVLDKMLNRVIGKPKETFEIIKPEPFILELPHEGKTIVMDTKQSVETHQTNATEKWEKTRDLSG